MTAQKGGEQVIIALGEKVFGALLAIAGAVIILSGHWTTTTDMIGDLIAGGLMLTPTSRNPLELVKALRVCL